MDVLKRKFTKIFLLFQNRSTPAAGYFYITDDDDSGNDSEYAGMPVPKQQKVTQVLMEARMESGDREEKSNANLW